MNAYQTEQNRIREITRQLAGMVADALGDNWTADTSPEFSEHRGVYLDGPDHARLFVALDWRNNDRVEISGTYPTHRDTYPRVQRFEIGVARDRGPAVVAREITRRLLPKYLPELERVRASNHAAAIAADAQNTVVCRLVEILPLAHADTHRAGEISFHRVGHEGYGNVKLYHDGAQGSLEIRSAPAGLLEAIAGTIAAYRASES